MFQSGANESSGSRLDLFLKTTVARKLGHIRSAPGARGAYNEEFDAIATTDYFCEFLEQPSNELGRTDIRAKII